jgi:serine/threonine-protein kinase
MMNKTLSKIILYLFISLLTHISSAQNYNVSTVAGNYLLKGVIDGTGTEAQFYGPTDFTVDANDNIFVLDDKRVRKISPTGVVTTVVGPVGAYGNFGYKDGTSTTAAFKYPSGIEVDANGNLYITDYGNNCIRKVETDGTVSTIAGSLIGGNDNGVGSDAKFYNPEDIVLNIDGNFYIVTSNAIRKMTPAGVVTTFAGSNSNLEGHTDGKGLLATFASASNICADKFGTLYVLESSRIRKITIDGDVTTLAGTGVSGYLDGAGNVAKFDMANGISVDANGNCYVSDYGNTKIRKVTPDGTVSTIAGTVKGFANGPGTSAKFNYLCSIYSTKNGDLLVGDLLNYNVSRITITTGIEADISSQLSLYPNPTGSFINLNFPQSIIGHVEIYDLNGTSFYAESFNGDRFIIPTVNLNQGIYIVKVMTSTATYTRQVTVLK